MRQGFLGHVCSIFAQRRRDAETHRGFWVSEKLLEGADGSGRALQWWGLASIYFKLCGPASLREALFVTSFVRGLRVRFSRRDAEAQSFF